jgi:hypothetical protein
MARPAQASGAHDNRRLRIAAAHLAAVGTEHQHTPPFMHRGNRQRLGGELDALAADARQEDLTFQGRAFLRARL